MNNDDLQPNDLTSPVLHKANVSGSPSLSEKRVIKFRAWLGYKMQNNVVPFQWDYCIDRMRLKCIESNGAGILGSGGTEATFEVGGYSITKGCLMEFTGLKDIANEDCYENDIVKAVWSEDINDELFGIGKVIFNCGCFMLEWIDDREANMELLGMIYKTGRPRVFKILGNEYENPELLRTVQQ
jgi:uncharacterized phage protein (TIGR01671 family)